MLQNSSGGPQLQLKSMQAQYLHQVAELHQSINPSPWSVSQWQACCDQPMYQNWVVLQANTDDDPDSEKLVAFASLICPSVDIELLNIGVAQEFQGKGIGEDLLRACLELAPENSEQCFLEVRRSNIPAINLYKKLEFEQVAERKDYYRLANGLVEDALVLRKLL